MLEVVLEAVRGMSALLMVSTAGVQAQQPATEPPLLRELVRADEPAALVALLQEEGYRAKLTVDSEGDPKIEGRVGQFNFRALFYGCESDKGCHELQLDTGFDMPDGLSFEKANEWNQSKRYGKVYLDDDQDPFLEMNINMDGGLTQENFLDTFEIWHDVVDEFTTFVEW